MNNLINKRFFNFLKKKITDEQILNKNFEHASIHVTKPFIEHLKETNNEYIFDNLVKYELILKKPVFIILKSKEFLEWFLEFENYYHSINNISTRKEFSANGLDTHKTKTEYGFLLIKKIPESDHLKSIGDKYEQALKIDKETPNLIYFFNKTYDYKVTKKYLLIIENLDVFSQIHLLDLNINFDNFDIIYGAGNNVTNSYFYDFFNSYKKIYTLLDIDFGGFKMYKSLMNNLNIPVINLYPNQIDNILEISNHNHNIDNIFSFIKSDKNRFSALDKEILSKVDKYNAGIEQEIYLNRELFPNQMIWNF